MGSKYQEQILEAAMAAFTRYGFKKVTMGDIASESGLSRPTLYAAFANKEEVFKGVVARFHKQALEEIRERIEPLDSLPAKLEQVFEVWLVRTYEMIHRTPDGKELVECTYEFGRDVIEEGYARLEELLVSIIAPHADRLALLDMSTERLARVLSTAARGMKEHARDVDELRQLVSGLIAMTVASLHASDDAVTAASHED